MRAHAGAWVLLVGADTAQRRALRRLLEPVGYRVLEAPDAIEAIGMLRRSAYALVVLFDVSQVAILSAAAADRRLAHHHAFVMLCSYTETCADGHRDVFTQLNLLVLRTPFGEEALLHTVARAARCLPVAALYPS